MSRQSNKLLGVFAGVLAAGVVAVNLTEHGTAPADERLLPGLKAQLNELQDLQISKGAVSVTVAREGEHWVVREQDNYPADAGKLREAMLALAEANKLEAKTADPERYAQLELAEDDNSTRVRLSGKDAAGFDPVSLILGKTAQGSYRYARIVEDPQSWLIDRNPDLPAEASAWLQKEVIDLAANRVQSIVIRHADGEEIRLARDAENILVAENVPDGRELSSASALNSIASALQNLTLDGVRSEAIDAESDLRNTYTTSDGLVVTVRRFTEGDDAWFSFTAAEQQPGSAAATEATGESAAATAANSDAANEEPAAAGADALNARLAGWWYRLPAYKANVLGRRWSDLLAAKDDSDE